MSKAARDLSLKKLKHAGQKLSEKILANNSRLVEKYHNDIQEVSGDFELKHVSYVQQLKEDLDDEPHKSILAEATAIMEQATEDYESYQQRLEDAAIVAAEDAKVREADEKAAEEKKTVTLKLQADESSFEAYVDLYLAGIEDSSMDPSLLKDELSTMQMKLKDIQDLYLKKTRLSKPDDVAEITRERLDFELKFNEKYRKMKAFLVSKRVNSAETPVASTATNDILKIKRVELPTFDGEMRAYPMFKRDFENVVIKSGGYDEECISHLLRNQCLAGEPKTLVRNMEKLDEIWKLLDDKYEDRAEVIDQIQRQIDQLRFLEDGDYAGVVKLVDIVERARLDLLAIKGHQTLTGPDTVRKILSKCPRSLKEEIARELTKVEPEEEFEKMIAVLVERRKDCQRLARVSNDTRAKSGKMKAAVNVAESKPNDPGGGGKKPWKCAAPGCKYKQKHFFSECRAFKKLTNNEKGQVVVDKKLCVLCFGGHNVSTCTKKTTGWKTCDVGGCGKWHSRSLHGATTPGLVLLTLEKNVFSNSGQTLLLIQSVPTTSGLAATTLWDTGSATNLVTFDFARQAELQGTECQFELTGIGEKRTTYKTKLFSLTLINNLGEEKRINAFGIEKIMAETEDCDIQHLAAMLGVQAEAVNRPVGPMDLLIGVCEVDLLPVRVRVVDKLALYSSSFGSGYVVGGSSGDSVHGLNEHAQQAAHAAGRVVKTIDFLSAEAHGVEVPRRCRNCRGCKECGMRVGQLTWTENMELSHIERGLSLDVDKKRWTAEYPFKSDPSKLADNYYQAYACLGSLERRLIRTGNLENFNQQFHDSIDRGVFQKVDPQEVKEYIGPVNYVTITEAFKDGEDTTTPLRLCMNSSMKYKGNSLNDLLMKGPSALNNIYSVLLNFRSYPCAFVKDISKFYNSVLASDRDCHLRRVLWRNGDQTVDPTIYKTNTVNFGDRPAGCIALSALRQTADLYKNIDEEAAEKLKNDNYVDDVASGGQNKQDAERLSTKMEEIVAQGGFHFKKTVFSGDAVKPVKVLGTPWDVERDKLYIDVKVNVSQKHKGLKVEPDMELTKIRENFPLEITKRIIWRVVLGQFDLLGLVCPFFIRLKLLMRDLSGEEGRSVAWDEPLKEDVRERFVTLLCELEEVKSIRFPRCFVPDNTDESVKPELLCFGDGSKQAFCSLVYIRWKLQDGSYKCFLLTGKTRVAPLTKISLVRIELLGAVTAVRLAESVENALKITFEKRYFFTDSTAVFGMIQGECGSMEEFVGVRVGEIKRKSNPEVEWLWIPGADNPSDLGTRDGTVANQLHEESTYQVGLPWMLSEEVDWPTRKTGGKVPAEELIPAARCVMVADTREPLIRLEKFSSVDKVLRILTYVCFFLSKLKDKTMQLKTKKADFFPDAENLLIFMCQSEIRKDFEKGKMSSLLPKLKDVEIVGMKKQIVVVSGRGEQVLQVGYDKENLPILNYDDYLARLYMIRAHEIDHSGVDRSLARSRAHVWIVKGRRVAQKVRKSCFKCKLRDKNLEKQLMAPLPDTRLPPAPVFMTTALDLFGPIEVRDTVKRRVKKKCWGVIFCCTKTSAVHLECTEDYSCDSFLLSLRRFFLARGTPSVIQSDPGSQLMAAAAELGKWNFSTITEWSERGATTWNFVPVNSQHYNGCAESMIKSTKRQLGDLLTNKLFTKGELDTFLAEVMYIINSRPLAKKPGEDIFSGGPITPLHLLGGRCTVGVPQTNVDSNPTLKKRLCFIENTVNEFWQKWFVQVFPDLVPCHKWKKAYRNVKVGDIVLLRDSNCFKRGYKLAKVTKAEPGKDDKVRRITVKYKNIKDSGQNVNKAMQTLQAASEHEVKSSIHNVVVIVPVDWSEDDAMSAATNAVQFKCIF